MPRIRSLKYEYFINEDLAHTSSDARLLGLGLTTIADREGRLEDRPLRIKVRLFPYHDVDIDTLLNELQDAHFLHRYEVNGKRYIRIINFLKHQKPHPKEAPSEIPSHEISRSGRGIKRKGKPRIAQDDDQGIPSPVVNGSGNGLGDLGSMGNGNGGSVNTHTDLRGGGVCVKSKFSLEQNLQYAKASCQTDNGIKQPEAWAAANYANGLYDEMVERFLQNPESHFRKTVVW